MPNPTAAAQRAAEAINEYYDDELPNGISMLSIIDAEISPLIETLESVRNVLICPRAGASDCLGHVGFQVHLSTTGDKQRASVGRHNPSRAA